MTMHRESQNSNTGQCSITITVTNRGGQSNRKKGHSRLINSICISLFHTQAHIGLKLFFEKSSFFLGIKQSTKGSGANLKKTCFLQNFAANFLLF